MTSPVERISGESKMSWPTNLLNGKTDSFTAQYLVQISSVKSNSFNVFPAMTRAAIHFEDIDSFAFDSVLHVHQADDFQFARHRVRVGADGVNHTFGKRVWR